jgi:LemA protein
MVFAGMGLFMIVILGLVVVVILAVIGIYNRLITLRNMVDEAWAQIEVQLRRRFDLIPNLVETVKGYAAHERETLEKVTAARSAISQAGSSVAEQAQAQNMLTGALKSLFAVTEAYPNLKADQNFLKLQEELTSTEGKIAYARQYYNDSVRGFNTAKQVFPANFISGMFNFKDREFYEIEEAAAREPVKVKFTKE